MWEGSLERCPALAWLAQRANAADFVLVAVLLVVGELDRDFDLLAEEFRNDVVGQVALDAAGFEEQLDVTTEVRSIRVLGLLERIVFPHLVSRIQDVAGVGLLRFQEGEDNQQVVVTRGRGGLGHFHGLHGEGILAGSEPREGGRDIFEVDVQVQWIVHYVCLFWFVGYGFRWL